VEPYQVYDARATPQGEAVRSNLFPKYDRSDSTPTGPLFISPDGGNESVDGKGPTVRSERRCCGLQVRTFIIILLILFVLVLIAVLVPILILRSRNGQSSTPSGLSLAQCETQFPCQNGGANFLMGNPLQCTCLCAAGFSGTQCQTEDSACVPFTSKDDSANGTSIGSAIEPLLQTAQANFSNYFNLSADRIIAQFSSNNVSCTSQNSLVVLNGSTSAAFDSSQIDRFAPNALVLEALTTLTVTKDQVETVLTTLPTITVTVSNVMTGPTTSGGAISTMTSSSVVTNTVTLVSQPGATLTPEDLVFGRCAILAVVQGFGVSNAADVQETMQLVINKGGTIVNDTTVGVAIDLYERTITGLPKGG
jgi:hypothetical protein